MAAPRRGRSKPKGKADALLVKNDPGAAVAVAYGRDGQMFVDPYTGTFTVESPSVDRRTEMIAQIMGTAFGRGLPPFYFRNTAE